MKTGEKKWTRELLISRIQVLHSQGHPLSYSAVRKMDPSMIWSAAKLWGNWRNALGAAGLKPEDHAEHWSWSRAECLTMIGRLGAEGRALNWKRVLAREPRLVYSAARHWGSWDQALHAAGLVPERIRLMRKPWTREEVVCFIRDRYRSGLSVNAGVFEGHSILRAAYRFFGTWDGALRGSGLDPQGIRQRGDWDKARVIQTIQERARQGLGINALAIHVERPDCCSAARRRFGSWDQALRAAGFDPTTVRRWRHPWTRETIIAELRRRWHAGLGISPSKLKPGSLVGAVYRIFGKWPAALSAAGLPVRKTVSWTPALVREAIAARQTKGLEIRSGVVRREDGRLHRAACLIFGSWGRALAPFATAESSPSNRVPTEKILASIRDRHEKGLPVSQARVKPRSLVGLGVSRFGCWSAALRAAGLDPEEISLHRKWNAEKVASAIQRHVALRGPISSSSVRRGAHHDSGLYEAAVRYYGCWDGALQAAGVNPATVQRQRKWSSEKVIMEIQQLAKTNRMVSREDQALPSAATRYFGSWNAAVAAAGVQLVQARCMPWTRSRIIMALRDCDSRNLPFVDQPVSLARSATRLFGSWKTALTAAFGARSAKLLDRPKPRGSARRNAKHRRDAPR